MEHNPFLQMEADRNRCGGDELYPIRIGLSATRIRQKEIKNSSKRKRGSKGAATPPGVES